MVMSYRLIATLFNVDELIVNKYVAESINNWLQNVLATKAFVSCEQNVLHTVDKGLCGQTSCNQMLIDTATYLHTINLPTLPW